MTGELVLLVGSLAAGGSVSLWLASLHLRKFLDGLRRPVWCSCCDHLVAPRVMAWTPSGLFWCDTCRNPSLPETVRAKDGCDYTDEGAAWNWLVSRFGKPQPPTFKCYWCGDICEGEPHSFFDRESCPTCRFEGRPSRNRYGAHF